MPDTSDQGFLGRWSRLKTTANKGEDTASTSTPPTVSPTAASKSSANTAPASVAPSTTSSATSPAPTLQDVAQLTAESDYRAFVARDVATDVKNAAMKKLFADPHFNVMDGMDVYIDDYSHPDPLAPALLRQMASAKFLKLTDDDDTAQTVAQSGPESSPPQDPAQDSCHDHADLRLQPNPAPGQQDAGPEPT